ncbi:ATP synthase subunit delta [Bacteroidia bacterium]|nr:ATP synthase subunit delta [Bacteroidia bacterium]
MTGHRLDIRYAKALYGYAESDRSEQIIYDDMVQLMSLYIESPDFKRFLSNPAIRPVQKGKILHVLLQDHVSALTLSFLMLVLRKLRISNILGIAKAYIEVFRDKKNIETVVISVAQEPSNAQQSLLQQKLEALLQKDVVCHYKINPNLLGGIKIQYNSLEFDASVASKIKRFKRTFAYNLHRSKL